MMLFEALSRGGIARAASAAQVGVSPNGANDSVCLTCAMRTSTNVTFPLLAMITLGCGEDGDGSDGAVHERAQLAIEESCQHLQDCGSKNYGSARSCVFQVSMSYEQEYKKRDAACREAWIVERECFTQQSCEQLGESCDAEGKMRWNVCKDWEN